MIILWVTGLPIKRNYQAVLDAWRIRFDPTGLSSVYGLNRNFSDIYSPVLSAEHQGEFAHRYILGLYDLLRRITDAFPDVLFEACAAGGNRFDMGMLDFSSLTPFNRKVIKKQVAFYKEHRLLLQFGRFYRLENPETPNGAAWIVVSENKKEAIPGVYQKLSRPNPPSLKILLDGLNSELTYQVTGRDEFMDIHDIEALADHYLYPLESFRTRAGGDELMQAGLGLSQRFHGGGFDETVTITGDFASRIYVLKAE
ncbi:MAG: hypothetical protein DRP49_07770 [Spirochaetes bacterium]|nr:MAG: hypothetical protein DRP49_07770 [Spirochaetota bacterium]